MGANLLAALLVAVNVTVLVWCVRAVWRFNARMSELWRLLETKGRAHRVKELRDDPVTNLPPTKYLYNEVDFEDPDIRELKLTLKSMHQKGVGSILVFTAVVIGSMALYEAVPFD